MAQLIKQAVLQNDSWQILPKDAVSEESELPPGKIVVHVSDWLARPTVFAERNSDTLGVWLDSDDEPELIADSILSFGLIAVNFPVFTDGRGYSSARLLRERYAFAGELRAIGDILVDQMFYLKRCGFDAFALRDDKSSDAAIEALSAFSETYQGASDQKDPLFRRR